MADIFLSYAREDIEKAQLLAEALQAQGWSVFWDRSSILPGEDFEEVIQNAIKEAYCVIVAWSGESRKSNWVRGEANIGLKQKKLIPILLTEIDPPLSFNSLHTEDFTRWNGNSDDNEFQKLISAVSRLVEPVITGGQNKLFTPYTINQASLVIPKMVTIPAGTFQMGSNDIKHGKPVHLVTIDKPFALGLYPVTFEEYDYYVDRARVMKPKHNGWGRGTRPLIFVSWDDAVAYAHWLSKQTGKKYRLPTEAEWEYAARAGTLEDYYGSYSDIEEYAWFVDNSDKKTHPVGEKQPNAFGLFDMCGNVWEWVQDCSHKNYDNAPDDGSVWDQTDGGNCSLRILRGGSWFNSPRYLNLSHRNREYRNNRNDRIGFRLALDLP